LTSDVS